MASDKKKCPMCGTKLKMINGRMTCKDCGYYLRDQNSQTDAGQTHTGSGNSWQTQGSGQTYSRQPGASQPQNHGRTYSTPPSQPGRGSAQGGNPGLRYGLITIGSVAAILLCAVIGAIGVNIFSELSYSADSKPLASSQEDRGSNSRQDSVSGEDSSTTAAIQQTVLPSSGFFQELVEVIFEKPCSSITAQEMASITLLGIDHDDNSIYYQLNDGDVMTLYFENSIGMDTADLKTFTGLRWISLDDDLSVGDLDGLQNLYCVYAENTIQEFQKIIPYPENITSLGAEDSIFDHTLEGIEAFPNLLYLTLEYGALDDISALKQMPGLLGLSLTDCDRLTDYSPLMSLTNLEQLSLETRELKSIDFVKVMPSLTELYVEDSQISDISALENCPNLTSLSLIDNYEVTDYSVVGSLTQLTYLSLSLGYGTELPSFEKLGNLQQLSLENASDLSPLRDVTSLTALNLKRCAGWELDAITSMQDLVYLSIHDFSSYVESLEPLTRLAKLEELDLTDTSIFGNVEEVFGIPTLRSLCLDDCQVGMDFDSIPTNENLEILSMNEIRILRDPTYNNGDTIALSEHYDMFDHFPNLSELYIASDKIDSIAFVENLPALQYLDISDNNVTSLLPLETLPDFRTVWCERNTILENLPEDSDIWVIMD